MKEDLMNEIQRIAGVNPRKCMRCGKCSGACPAYDEMEYHPHQFVSMVENGRIDELMASKGIYTCLTALPVSSAVAQCRAGQAHRGRPPRGHPPAGHEPSRAGADPGAARRRAAAAGHHQRIPEIQKVRGDEDAENRCICLSLRHEHRRDGRRRTGRGDPRA